MNRIFKYSFILFLLNNLSAPKVMCQKGYNPVTKFEFIEHVADQEIDSLYVEAERAYFEALTPEALREFKEPIQEELYRLRPIIDSETFKRWVKYLRREDGQLIVEVKEFWVRENTFLSSDYNERLIEHWKRVAHAKREYNINTKSGFGTDDRGTLYVKLGKPTRIKEGSVSLSEYYDPVSGISIPIQNNIYFEYELWYYEDRSYVFGVPGTGGPFGLQRGMLDLIPEAGNRPGFYFDPSANINQLADQQANLLNQASGNAPPTQQAGGSAPPGMKQISRDGASLLIQYSVLEQTATTDPFYLNLFSEMSQDLVRNNLNGSSNTFNSTASTQNVKYKALERNWAINKSMESPLSYTETKSPIQDHKVNTYYYNFLNEQFEPVYLIITEVLDYTNLQLYFTGNNISDLSTIYQIDHFATFDRNWEKLSDQVFSDLVARPGYSNFHSYVIESSGSEILLQSSFIDSSKVGQGLNKHIISSGNSVNIEGSSPLAEELERDGYAVSEIMLAANQEESLDTRVPFFPSLDKTFESGSEMILYFETYGIQQGDQFGVKYADERDGNTIEVAFTSDGALNKVWFMVNLSEENYPKGEHEMQLELNYRGKITKKSIKFEVQ